jgi:hypothetical protein
LHQGNKLPFSLYLEIGWCDDYMILCRKPVDGEPSKAAEQQPVNVQTTPSLAVASAPPPSTGTSLTHYSNADARSSTQRILRYLESLKDAEADWEGNISIFTALGYSFFC